jgi:5'-methylthioadenosine phosphorylase
LVVIQRHGDPRNIPPHMVNHRANIFALEQAGARSMVGINSVGALRKDMPIPSIVIPDDFFDLNPPTFFDSEIKHVVPGYSEMLRRKMLEAAKDLGLSVIDKGVYVQMKGPRLETKAEIRVISKWGDVVGMNSASEATLANELGCEFAAICSVDNYAHGLGDKAPDYREILAVAKGNQERVLQLMVRLIEGYL